MSGLGSNLRALANGCRPAKDARVKFIKRGWMTPGPDGHITPEGLAELREREKQRVRDAPR